MLACLFSGGKDSTLALHKVYETGKKTDLLITMKPKNDFSYMFHKPNLEYTRLQAEALGIRQVFAETKGEKEEELKDLEKALVDNGVTELITGAVASRYQGDRVNAMCARLNIKHLAPLWGIDPLKELNELADNFKAIITQVSAEGLDESFLGRIIDKEMIEKLLRIHEKYRINLLFEGGEAESFVLDAPLFSKKIEIRSASKIVEGTVGRYVIEKAILTDK